VGSRMAANCIGADAALAVRADPRRFMHILAALPESHDGCGRQLTINCAVAVLQTPVIGLSPLLHPNQHLSFGVLISGCPHPG
jgi:hypothetical protein